MKAIGKYKTKVAIIMSCILWLAIVYLWISHYEKWQLKEQLKFISPLFLTINFYLILFLIILNYKSIKQLFSNLPKNILVIVIAIAILGALMSGLIPARTHRIYYDETIYQHIGQNIAYLNKAQMCNYGNIDYDEFTCYQSEYNKEPNGYPLLLSIAYRLLGCSENVSYLMNNLIYGLSLLTIFFIASILFESHIAGIYSSLIFCFIPVNLIWSNNTSAELCSSCFAGLAFLAMLLFIKNSKPLLFVLALLMLAFSIQFRPESPMIILIVFLALLLFKRDILKDEKYYLYTIIFLVLVLPVAVHFYAVQGEAWGATHGSKLALKYFTQNIRANGLFYLINVKFPLLFSVLFFIGLFAPRKWKEKSVIFLWFLLFWGIFVIFYAGSYEYGADVRFSMVSYMPLALLAGFGLKYLEDVASKFTKLFYLRTVIVLILIISLLSFLPYVRAVGQEAWGARADYDYAKEMAKLLPVDSLILSHNPNMFFLWGKNAAQASLATYDKPLLDSLFDRYTGGIYFHYSFWCNVPDKVQNEFCENILCNYKATLIKEYKEKYYKYALYKIEKKEKG
jgi:hypothetical protein